MVSTKEVLASGLLDFEVFPVDEETTMSPQGENGKGLLVVLGEKATPELTEFMEKILASVGFDLAVDAQTVELTDNKKFGFNGWAKKHEVKHAIFFGIKPAQARLNFNAQLYQPFRVSGISFLFSDQLSVIQADPLLKRPLWEGLKKCFV